MEVALFNTGANPKCKGCSILTKPLGDHCILDYEYSDQKDILFLSDFPKVTQGRFQPFRSNEYGTILHEIRKLGLDSDDIGFSSSVKCPLPNAKDIRANDRKICRAHLEDTILQYKPKLIFVCGSLASNMIFGRAISESKIRGEVQDYEIGGFETKVCLIFHPWQVVSEPRNRYLFNMDIRQAVEYGLRGKEKKNSFKFDPVFTKEDLEKYENLFVNSDSPMSLDIETTGLNFLKDTVHTIALSVYNSKREIESISIPIDHVEDPNPECRDARIDFIKRACSNNHRNVILQKAQFDLKFLIRIGITDVCNVWDCKIMQFLVREDIPRSLAALVKYHCPGEL